MSKNNPTLGESLQKNEIHYENFQEGIEKFYFTVVDIIEDMGYKINKTEDQFLTSPGSAQWQVFEQRKAVQQEKASQYLANIGRMTKDMMVLYRELKIQDERLGFYKEAEKGSSAAEVSLKSLWIDLVEGGSKNTTSVLGLAQQVGFVTLPDLFFKLNPTTVEAVDKQVNKVETNTQVKNVLKRKLTQYVRWKDRTYKELTTRRHFNIKYLAQHFDVIKMYLEWVKPYLKNVKNLTQQSKKGKSYQLLQTSESSISDIEIIAKTKEIDAVTEYKYVFPIIRLKFHHRTRPVMAYQGQEYSKGAIQLGRIECEMEGFAVTEAEYNKYIEAKEGEVLEILAKLDESMRAFLSDSNSKADFEAYLAEARDEKIESDTTSKKKSSIFDMFKLKLPKKSKTGKNEIDYSEFIEDYRKADSKAKKGVSKSALSKIRKKHRLSGSNAEKESKQYELEKDLAEEKAKKSVDNLITVLKIKYGMIRNE